MIQTGGALNIDKAQAAQTREPVQRQSRRKRQLKQRLTVTLPAQLLNRLRNAVYWTPTLTLAGVIESAVAAKLDHLETLNGEPFPTRNEELKGGRPREIRPASRPFL
jgi:hypothetical protein